MWTRVRMLRVRDYNVWLWVLQPLTLHMCRVDSRWISIVRDAHLHMKRALWWIFLVRDLHSLIVMHLDSSWRAFTHEETCIRRWSIHNLIGRNPSLPRGASLLGGFQTKHPEEEDLPRRATPQNWSILGVVLQGGSSSSGFLVLSLETTRQRSTPRKGRVSCDQVMNASP